MQGTTIGVITGDTRSLDYGSHAAKERQGCKRSAGSCDVGETWLSKLKGDWTRCSPTISRGQQALGPLYTSRTWRNKKRRGGSMRQDMHETVQTTVELELN